MGNDILDDPAASMSLLSKIVQTSLDPGYKQASEAEKTDLGAVKNMFIFFLVVVLMWGSTICAKALYDRAANRPPAAQELARQVQLATDCVEELQENNDALEAKLAATSPNLVPLTVEKEPQVISANSTVTGPGITVVITDNFGGGTPLMRDRDMRTLLNLLWSGGAEAIAIDGLRIGPQTTVRTAGASILVNLVPITSPYVIEAIGSPEKLEASFSKGLAATAVRDLETQLGVSISTSISKGLTVGALTANQLLYAQEQTFDNEVGKRKDRR